MTLFNKLSNFAHKAKDSAIAKNVISKDKRLDLPLSNSVQLDKIHFDLMSNFGLESTISVMAYDTTAGLLAIAFHDGGTQTTQLRVFGKGVSTTLPLPNIEPIKYLQFKTGCSLLVLIDKKNIIYTVDLKKQHIQYMLPTKGIITSYCYATGTDWLFIGFADGCVDVFDLRLGQLAKYGIPDLTSSQADGRQNQQASEQRHVGSMVVSLELHPTNLNWILIGYESMVFLWDIREQMIHSTYALQSHSDTRLSSLAWSPQGDRFMAGYDDGYLHLWAVDSEQQPVLSRQVFPSLDKSQPCEAVYKLAWYFDDGAQKSYLVVCGGSAIKDIYGIHVLEFDMTQPGDARKQSIIPSSSEIMDFILLWTDAYSPRNPLGVVLLGCDGSVSAHGLDHGYPELTMPPSLAMTHPFVSNACFIPMVAEDVYRKLTTLTDADRQTRYMPLTGGGVGPNHIYKIPSNDILVTIHVGEVIQFWDASYTSLRPLPQLTIRCLDDLEDTTSYLCCIDLNSVSGTLSVGFSNGTVLLYEVVNERQQQQEQQSDFDKTNAHFISQCDDTINELAGILNDMQQSPTCEDDPHFDKEVETDSATNPFLSQDATNPADDLVTQHHDADDTKPQHSLDQQPDDRITTLKRSRKCFGFSPDIKIKLDGTIELITSTGLEIIACATSQGQVVVINTTLQKIYHTIDIKAIHADILETETEKGAHQQEHTQGDMENMPTISYIKFFNTYAYGEITRCSTQLLIGLSNNDIYQCDVLSPNYQSPSLLYRNRSTPSSIQDIHVINLDGQQQLASDTIINNSPSIGQQVDNSIDDITPSPPDQKELAPMNSSLQSPDPELPPTSSCQQQEEEKEQLPQNPSATSTVSVERGRSFLRRKSVKKSTKKKRSTSNASLDSQDEAWEVLSKTSTKTTVSSTGSSSSKHSTGRPHAPAYAYQEQPHFIITSNAKSVCVILSGFGLKLYEFRTQSLEDDKNPDDTVISTMPISIDDVKCLSVLLKSGYLVILSLPHLQPIARTPLPQGASKLNEATLTTDGRILLWAGKYDMQEWMYLHSETSLPFGHSVELFNIDKQLPSHPCKAIHQKSTKKSWFGAVAGAFKKEPLSVEELDTIMGRINTGQPQQQLRTSSTSESSTGVKKSGVFKELGDKMNERGERLNDLGKKFSDMNDASGDFLKAVKDYNERQAQKKWWEF